MNKIININEKLLIKESRSFSIPILQLEPSLRNQTMVAYNVNKTLDSIENNNDLELSQKLILIDEFCDYLIKDEAAPSITALILPEYVDVIALYNTFSNADKQLILACTLEMAEGMKYFMQNTIETEQDMEKYCYYVAGTVGVMMNRLFISKHEEITIDTQNKLNHHAISLGHACQKVNIIRDFYEDTYIFNQPFWPREWRDNVAGDINILNRFCYSLLTTDIKNALVYYQHLPKNNSYDRFIRIILSSLFANIKLFINNPKVITVDKVKVEKTQMLALVNQVLGCTPEEFITHCEQSYHELCAAIPEHLIYETCFA